MKKTLFTLTLAALAFTSNGQDEERSFEFSESDIFVEGNLSFSSENNKNNETKTNTIEFNPKGGLFLSEKLAAGGQINLNRTVSKNDALKTENQFSTFGIGAFARYYFFNLGARIKTYGEFGLGFSSSKGENTSSGVTRKEPKIGTFNLGLDLGVNIFLTEQIALNYGLTDIIGFSSSKFDVEGAKATNNFNINLNQVSNILNAGQFGLLWRF